MNLSIIYDGSLLITTFPNVLLQKQVQVFFSRFSPRYNNPITDVCFSDPNLVPMFCYVLYISSTVFN